MNIKTFEDFVNEGETNPTILIEGIQEVNEAAEDLVKYVKSAASKTNMGGGNGQNLLDSAMELASHIESYQKSRDNRGHGEDGFYGPATVSLFKRLVDQMSADDIKWNIINDHIDESIDVKYWADYHTNKGKIFIDASKPGGSVTSGFLSKVANAVEDEVRQWNSNNRDGKTNEIGKEDEKRVMNLALDFFKAAGWISTDIIQAMIAQS